MPAIDWIEIALIAAALPVLWLAFKYAAWEKWNDRRRSDRLVHRNLQRMCGR
jgi:hypothetical protein